MQLSKELKERTLTAILADRANYPSDSKHATAIGILARRLNVPLRGEIEWKVAKTDTYSYITSQLEACQERSLSALLCDIPNIGKTFSARHYARTHKHVVYIDCSQTKTKVRLVRS
ncbi:MAG: ATP-binding protein, partial [Porphyromonadaceae bacterium]|nr:ATP-binding protein [Porphyromonadaceae bacterium]